MRTGNRIFRGGFLKDQNFAEAQNAVILLETLNSLTDKDSWKGTDITMGKTLIKVMAGIRRRKAVSERYGISFEERFAQLEQNLNTKVDELRRDVEKLLADLRVELSEKSESIERDGVKRDRLATKLEALAASLRDRSE